MKHWGSAIFPLSILLVLTALTYWLRYATELPASQRDGKNRHDPDYIINDSILYKLDKAGRLQYTLKSVEIRHYPDDDSTDLIKPDMLYLHSKKPPLTMRAERGHVSRDGEQVDLYDDVQVHREASAKNEALTAYTPRLTVLPNDERAFTKSPVLITKGKSWIKGVGMQVNSRTQVYILESQAVAVLESKYAAKKTP